MSLATRPKPTVHHKKRQAGHHRHNKNYVRPYWPYLPMLAIVGIGLLANQVWTADSMQAPAASQPLTRVQALTGNQTGSFLAIVIAITAAAFALFVFRHSIRLHRLINRGEAFVSQNPWLDIVTVMVFTAGFVLTRPNGVIG